MYHKETSKIYHAVFRPWILGAWHQGNPAQSVITGTFISYLYNLFYYVIHLFKENTLLFFIIPGLIIFFRKKLYKKEGFCIILMIFLSYFVYFTYILNKQTRFLIMFLPYASLIAAYGFYHYFTHIKKDRIRILIVVFVIISLAGIISRDLYYYNWRANSEPPIVKNYYKFFIGKEIEGPILTTDPVPVAYIDAKFVPLYFSDEVAYQIYISESKNSFATIFSPESFYCSEEDIGCRNSVKNISNMIQNNNILVFSEVYNNQAYYIYVNRNSEMSSVK
jgi:asparagine N-glycosylation enzyme membrane subunit Stt3